MRKLTGYHAILAAVLLAVGCNSNVLGSSNDDGGTDADVPSGVLDVQPGGLQTISLTTGQAPPVLSYAATWNGQPIAATWVVDRGEIGTMPYGPAAAQTFTPSGTTGGLVTLRASANGQRVSRQVMVLITAPDQNGANPSIPSESNQIPRGVGDLTSGGGVGGVGGEGLGPAVTDPNTQNALKNPGSSGAAQGLVMLYPYDGTVWPRGILAPNLMWRWSTNDADAVRIELSTSSGSFRWAGTFGRPAILATTGGAFIRHPIPQDIWERAVNSAGGLTPSGQADRLSLKLTIARGGQGYGPLTQSWIVAPGRLSGIIYYQSYGTLLARNYPGAVGGDGRFGGAVLSIHVGDTAPKLTAGTDGNSAQCRTCHSVSADGTRLVVQHGDNNAISSSYALTANSATEQMMTLGATYPAIYPDGSMALAPSGALLPLPGAAAPLTSSGLPAGVRLGTPAFAPDGKLVAANPMAFSGIANAPQKLVVMSFDPMTRAFGAPVVVVDDTGQPAETRPGWPAVFPDAQSVIFHHQTAAGLDGNTLGDMATRKGARASLAWAGVTSGGPVTPLNQLNGKNPDGSSYLPKLQAPITMSCTADGSEVGNLDTDHGNDVSLNYEPTVNPVGSGGYAWVVFTSRRLYGNIATLPPYCSDPRGVDLVRNITTKKLWVAAVDISGKPGADASHPAFYLPAQELLAGNARGFWVLDPCKANGQSCQSGDQCCGGFCQPDSTSGALVCSPGSANQCSAPQERCTTASDCCDKTNRCINNFCTVVTIG